MNALFSKTILGGAALAAFALATVPASAGEVHNRVGRQQQRIDQGVKSGQLTQGEYVRDQNHLDRINAQRRNDLRQNGGTLTGGEKAQLNRELNRNSERVYFSKHNTRTQP